MNDIIKNIKSVEDSHVLIDGFTQTVKNEVKKQKVDFILYFSTFGCFINATSNFFSSKRYNSERN